MHFLFASHQSDQPFLGYGQCRILLEKNTHPKFEKKHVHKKLKHHYSKIKLDNKHDQGNKASKFCNDSTSGSHFIMQTSKFLINATAVTLGQDNGRSSSTFSQTYTFFSKLCKVLHKRFWRERQTSLRRTWTLHWKRIKNDKSPQTGMT